MWALRNSFLMSSIDTILLLFLATGFTVGFGHCIGMCGPIVVSLSLAQGKRGTPTISSNLLMSSVYREIETIL